MSQSLPRTPPPTFIPPQGGDSGKNCPLFTLDTVPTSLNSPTILATAGNDSSVHIWRVKDDQQQEEEKREGVEHVVTLNKHEGGGENDPNITKHFYEHREREREGGRRTTQNYKNGKERKKT